MAFEQSNIAEAGTVCSIVYRMFDTIRDLPCSAHLGMGAP